jgi:crotonobetaine/carnitine-CoA ligase
MSQSGLTFAGLLDARARESGDKVFVRFDDTPITFADMRRRVTATANGLLDVGIGPGDTVAMFTGNCPEWVDVWLAAPEIGAVSTPVNALFRGDFLAHQLRDAGASLIVVDALFMPLLAEVLTELPSLRTVVVRGGAGDASEAAGGAFANVRVVPASALAGNDDKIAGGRPLAWNEPACLFYTSGTTGPSKGAVLTQHYLLTSASTFVDAYGFTPDDVIYGAVPLFHFSGSLGVVLPALVVGLSSVLDGAFSVSACWDRVRTVGATVFVGVGPMVVMLWSLPPDPSDAELPLRLMVAAPIPAELHAPVEERYGLTIVAGYGMTEVFPLALHRADQPVVPGSAGLPNPNFEVRLLDDDDAEVPIGSVGEIACRPRVTHAMFEGYHGRPEATVEQFRNLWFHTGDLGRFDEDGVLFFVDRKKDAIRRRGENISSFEVERSVLQHPAVAECAAHAVPSPLGEDDVKVCVVLAPGATLTYEELMDHCLHRLPKFAAPRYLEFVEALPKNAVGRVQKMRLREAPLSEATWDRDAADYAIDAR